MINIYYTADNETAKILSNLAETPFELDGAKYSSVEGFWQSLKFPKGSEERRNISELSGKEAKKAGKSATNITEISYLGKKIISGFDEHKKLMKRALKAKFEQNPEAMKILLATGDALLIHEPTTTGGMPMPDSKTIPGDELAIMLMDIREDLKKLTINN